MNERFASRMTRHSQIAPAPQFSTSALSPRHFSSPDGPGNAAWAALVAAFRRVVPAKSHVVARVVRERRTGAGKVDRSWFEYKGDVEGFLGALPQIDVDEKP